MSDEEATLQEDSAATETADTNWEQRFKDTQGAYTKSQQELATERGVWEDEQAALARLAEKFPHLFEDEDEETEDDEPLDDPRDQELAELRKQLGQVTSWQQSVENDRGEQRFNTDLSNVLDGRELGDKQRQWIKDRTFALGNNRKALEQAVEEWFEIAPAPKKAPRAPHVVTAGAEATQVPDFSQMTREQIDEYMVGQARALDAQT